MDQDFIKPSTAKEKVRYEHPSSRTSSGDYGTLVYQGR